MSSAPALVDEGFRKVPYWWNWRRVFLEEDYPPGAVLDEQAFDEATAREAVEAMVALYEKLQPHVKST